jgi:hypothetical protein
MNTTHETYDLATLINWTENRANGMRKVTASSLDMPRELAKQVAETSRNDANYLRQIAFALRLLARDTVTTPSDAPAPDNNFGDDANFLRALSAVVLTHRSTKQFALVTFEAVSARNSICRIVATVSNETLQAAISQAIAAPPTMQGAIPS